MRSKLLGGAAVIALTAYTVLATAAPASASWYHGGVWPGAVAAGVVGGALAAATSPFWGPGYYDYDPGYAYAPYGYQPYAYGPPPGATVAQNDDAAYCAQRYRSYDPASGTFLGFDGQRHPCP